MVIEFIRKHFYLSAVRTNEKYLRLHTIYFCEYYTMNDCYVLSVASHTCTRWFVMRNIATLVIVLMGRTVV